MKFIGYDGEMELEGGAVKIKKGKKDTGRTIRLSDVVSVTLKKPVLTMAGCVHIQVIGERTYPVGATAATYAPDRNTICFRKPQYGEAEAFKEALDKAIAQGAGGAGGSPVDTSALRDLKQLLDDGIITQAEFDQKKAQLLGL